jgi:hypothetical protein
MFSNLTKISDFLDYEGRPYRYLIRCDIEGTSTVVHIEKWEGSWKVAYVQHGSEQCEHCGEVQLYSKCEYLGGIAEKNYREFVKWIKTEKKKAPF